MVIIFSLIFYFMLFYLETASTPASVTRAQLLKCFFYDFGDGDGDGDGDDGDDDKGTAL